MSYGVEPQSPRKHNTWRAVLAVILIGAALILGAQAVNMLVQEYRKPTAAETQFDPNSQPTYAPDGVSPESLANGADDVVAEGEANRPDPATGTDEDVDMMDYLRWHTGPAQPLPEGTEQGWACKDESQTDEEHSQLTWEQARHVEGAAIFIPSLCVVSPTTASGTFVRESGDLSLTIPPSPWATRYEATPEVGSGQGNTIFAGHVNTQSGSWSPFSNLRNIPKGAPIIVRDDKGKYHVYKEVKTEEGSWDDIASRGDGFFRADGPETLSLVTCTGAPGLDPDASWLEYSWNLVVTATPVSS